MTTSPNVLFVCTSNVARSQAAAAYFNRLFPEGHADSAGTVVERENETIAEYGAPNTIEVLAEQGIDGSGFRRHQVTKDMLEGYDKIIVMAAKETVPDWLANHPKAERWEIFDPRSSEIDGLRAVFEDVQQKVRQLGEL